MKFDILNAEFFANLYFTDEESDYNDDNFFYHPMDGVGDHGVDDDEMNFVRLSHRCSIIAYYGHEDRMKSHIYDTYLSAKAEVNGVRERDSR